MDISFLTVLLGAILLGYLAQSGLVYGAGVEYSSYWPDSASRWYSWLASIEIATVVQLKRLAISVIVAIPYSWADLAILAQTLFPSPTLVSI